MNENYNVSSSPHIRDKVTSSNIMLMVVISLLPATFFGIWNFRHENAWILIVVTTAAAGRHRPGALRLTPAAFMRRTHCRAGPFHPGRAAFALCPSASGGAHHRPHYPRSIRGPAGRAAFSGRRRAGNRRRLIGSLCPFRLEKTGFIKNRNPASLFWLRGFSWYARCDSNA